MQQALYDICPKFFISGFNCSAPLKASASGPGKQSAPPQLNARLNVQEKEPVVPHSCSVKFFFL